MVAVSSGMYFHLKLSGKDMGCLWPDKKLPVVSGYGYRPLGQFRTVSVPPACLLHAGYEYADEADVFQLWKAGIGISRIWAVRQDYTMMVRHGEQSPEAETPRRLKQQKFLRGRRHVFTICRSAIVEYDVFPMRGENLSIEHVHDRHGPAYGNYGT